MAHGKENGLRSPFISGSQEYGMSFDKTWAIVCLNFT